MKIPDVNLLIYAHDATSPFHRLARTWFTATLKDPVEQIGIAPVAALAFVRIICNPRIFGRPLPVVDACALVGSWLEAGAILLDVRRDHFEGMGRLMSEAYGGPNLLTDAHLAMIAIERGATLCSNDRDFQRFKGLRLLNPLE